MGVSVQSFIGEQLTARIWLKSGGYVTVSVLTLPNVYSISAGLCLTDRKKIPCRIKLASPQNTENVCIAKCSTSDKQPLSGGTSECRFG